MSDWKAPNLEALCGSFLIIASATTAVRVHARKKQSMSLWADDWFVFAALVTFIGTCICIFIGIHDKSFGISSFSLTPEFKIQTQERGENLLTAVSLISSANLAFTKLSAVFFYKRLFDVPGITTRTMRVILWSTIAVLGGWLITFQMLLGFQCGTHYSALWTSVAAHEKYCVYTYPGLEGLVISDVILDVWIIFMPIPWVNRYVMSRAKRFLVSGLFLLSFVGLAASIARMVVSVELVLVGPVKAQKEDPRRIDSRLFFYFVLESGMAILAINLPVIFLSLVRMIPRAVTERLVSFSRSVTSILSRSSRSSHRKASLEDGPASQTNLGPQAAFSSAEKVTVSTTQPKPRSVGSS